jgi:ASC-1-like (ASCH) protein
MHANSLFTIASYPHLVEGPSRGGKKTVMVRLALTNEQRKAIRTYDFVTHRCSHDQRSVISWFYPTFQQQLSQPQVSKILSQ